MAIMGNPSSLWLAKNFLTYNVCQMVRITPSSSRLPDKGKRCVSLRVWDSCPHTSHTRAQQLWPQPHLEHALTLRLSLQAKCTHHGHRGLFPIPTCALSWHRWHQLWPIWLHSRYQLKTGHWSCSFCAISTDHWPQGSYFNKFLTNHSELARLPISVICVRMPPRYKIERVQRKLTIADNHTWQKQYIFVLLMAML